ncbi:FAD-dependent monooxygenase [Saccharothrix isguenensis]
MTKRAVIVGAGIAGLGAALRLRQAGWQPVVVERAPSRRSGGYAVTFAGLGYDAAERMGVLGELEQRHITPDDMVYVRPDGTTRFTVPGATVRALVGRRSLNLLRGDIEDVLYRAVEGDADIRFGTTVTSVEQHADRVEVGLSDGSSEVADLLVGADGLHSRTRSLVFGPERDHLLDLDHVVGVFMVDGRPDGLAPGATASLTSQGRTLAAISLGGDRSAAFFGFRTDDVARDLAAGPQARLPEVFADMGWLAPDLLRRLRTADSVYYDTLSQVVMDRWSSGRVVLLGDAAWCVTLFAGYGSSLALGGADLLGAALEESDDVPAVLAAWEGGLRPEVRRKQKLGRRVKGIYAPADPFRLWLRDLPLRTAALPPVSRLLKRRLQLGG